MHYTARARGREPDTGSRPPPPALTGARHRLTTARHSAGTGARPWLTTAPHALTGARHWLTTASPDGSQTLAQTARHSPP